MTLLLHQQIKEEVLILLLLDFLFTCMNGFPLCADEDERREGVREGVRDKGMEGEWFQSSNLVWKSRLVHTLPVNFLL